MARDAKLDETISAWLVETAPSGLPGRVLDATFERTRRTRQHIGWQVGLGRRRMPRFVPALGGAALVVSAAVIALNVMAPVGPGESPSPPPLATPTTAPSTAPTTAAIPTPPPQDQWDCIVPALGGSAYSASAGTISVAATVPAGWHGESAIFDVWNGPCLSSSSLRLQVALIEAVYTDACHWLFTEVAMTTPAEVVAALAAQIGYEPIGPTNATVGGRPASRFDYPKSTDLQRDCDENHAFLTAHTSLDTGALSALPLMAPAPDEAMTFYVVDVDGVAVGVGALMRDATPRDVAELEAIIASLQFEP